MTPYTKQIVELHKIHKAIENCGCNKDDGQGGGESDSGNLLMSLIPNRCPKPDLFLYIVPNSDPIDVTNYKIDDFINLYEEEGSDLTISCLYKSSNLNPPIITNIIFGVDGPMYFSITTITNDTIESNEGAYNNETYYYYHEVVI